MKVKGGTPDETESCQNEMQITTVVVSVVCYDI